MSSGIFYVTVILPDGQVRRQIVPAEDADPDEPSVSSIERLMRWLDPELFVQAREGAPEHCTDSAGFVMQLLASPCELPEVMTLRELSERMPVNEQTLARAVDAGRVPGARVRGSRRYKRRSVQTRELVAAFEDTLAEEQGCEPPSNDELARRLTERAGGVVPESDTMSSRLRRANWVMEAALGLMTLLDRHPDDHGLLNQDKLALIRQLDVFCSVREIATIIGVNEAKIYGEMQSGGTGVPGALRIGPPQNGSIVIHRDTFIRGALAGKFRCGHESRNASPDLPLEQFVSELLRSIWPWLDWAIPEISEDILRCQGTSFNQQLEVHVERVAEALVFSAQDPQEEARVQFRLDGALRPGMFVVRNRDDRELLGFDGVRGFLLRGLARLLCEFGRVHPLLVPLDGALRSFAFQGIQEERASLVETWVSRWSSPSDEDRNGELQCRIWSSDGSSLRVPSYHNVRTREGDGGLIVEFWGRSLVDRRAGIRGPSRYLTQLSLLYPPSI